MVETTQSDAATRLAPRLDDNVLDPVVIGKNGEIPEAGIAMRRFEELVEQLLSSDERLPAAPRSGLERVEAFERSRDRMALELSRSLAQDNITTEEFLRDILD